MGISKIVAASCDGTWDEALMEIRDAECERDWGDVFASTSDAITTLRQCGWTVGNRVLCPVCAKLARQLRKSTRPAK